MALSGLIGADVVRISPNAFSYKNKTPTGSGTEQTKMQALFSNCLLLETDVNQHVVAPASVAQLDATSDWRPGGRGFNPRPGRRHSFVETDHEIFSTVILSLPLIQEGQLSVSGERMCIILVNHLED